MLASFYFFKIKHLWLYIFLIVQLLLSVTDLGAPVFLKSKRQVFKIILNLSATGLGLFECECRAKSATGPHNPEQSRAYSKASVNEYPLARLSGGNTARGKEVSK